MKSIFWPRLLATALTLLCLTVQAQSNCQFFDDFSNPAGWTQVGALVTIDNGAVAFQNGAPDSEQRRVYKNIGATLAANTPWSAGIDFTPVSVGQYGGPHAGHAILSLTAGTQEPFSNCPDVPCTGYPAPMQDAIICFFGSPSVLSDGNSYFFIRAVEGSNSSEYVSPLITANTLGVPYFIRLDRLDATTVRLGVFSDAAKTVPLAGSPVLLTIPASIGGLNTVQHGNVARGGFYRELTGQVDNVCISWPEPGDCSPSRTLSAVAGDTININTGVDENLTPLAFNVQDPRWSIVSNVLPPLSTVDRWNFVPVTSQWIGFDQNQGSLETSYRVRFTFCTETCGDYRLNFRMLADNGACVFIDGAPVPSSWWPSHVPIPDCTFNPWDQTPFIPTAGYLIDHPVHLMSGLHTLELEVVNQSGTLTSINIKGKIEVIGTKDCICPPDRTLGSTAGDTININTGVNENLQVLPFGNIDPRWSIVSNTLPPMSTLDRWNFTPMSSQWIGFDNNQGTSETNYKVRFTFCTQSCGDYRLHFRMLADNGACVYLDGVPVPSNWWLGNVPIPDCNFNPGDQSPFIPTAGYLIDKVVYLLSGPHTLEIDVVNFSGSLTSINILGKIETVSAKDCMCPEDRTLGVTVGDTISLNTGVDAGLQLLAFGAPDPRWNILSNHLPSMTALDRWNFNPATSEWIGFDNNQGTEETNYKVRFTFCTSTCGIYKFYFRMLADNGACVYVDDQLIPSNWWLGLAPIPNCNYNPGDQSPFIPTAGYLIDHRIWLLAGTHTVDIDVTNFFGSLTSINVLGRVELEELKDCRLASTDDAHTPEKVKLFPNPAKDQLSVTWEKAAPQRLWLTNVLGQTFREMEVLPQTDRLDIPLEGLQPGTYFLTWQDSAGHTVSRNFVKM